MQLCCRNLRTIARLFCSDRLLDADLRAMKSPTMLSATITHNSRMATDYNYYRKAPTESNAQCVPHSVSHIRVVCSMCPFSLTIRCSFRVALHVTYISANRRRRSLFSSVFPCMFTSGRIPRKRHVMNILDGYLILCAGSKFNEFPNVCGSLSIG